MICELCGKEQERTTSVQIEGTYLRVCKECARFGDTVKPGAKTGGAQAQTVIAARLENRERRMKTRDVYSTGERSRSRGRITRTAFARPGEPSAGSRESLPAR